MVVEKKRDQLLDSFRVRLHASCLVGGRGGGGEGNQVLSGDDPNLPIEGVSAAGLEYSWNPSGKKRLPFKRSWKACKQ